ncbi:hypothetical protein CQA01_28040 [Cyclobacterium qasimii]|uniref:Uncharacterized protein n=1 Tax=Cyclobacterium qasimii TaxID=1350429 RepID=A0A512CDX6_9BACT|nr:hypothetical protein CQA01_28040 [Cyclobacterium qasimii]
MLAWKNPSYYSIIKINHSYDIFDYVKARILKIKEIVDIEREITLVDYMLLFTLTK